MKKFVIDVETVKTKDLKSYFVCVFGGGGSWIGSENPKTEDFERLKFLKILCCQT